MTTVKIDIDMIGAAITAAEDLASSIDSQSAAARSASPISLPSLADGTVGKKSQWIRDHLEDLTTRRDLAILLDTKGTGSASYTVVNDTLSGVKEMLGQELADSVSDLDHKTDPDEIARITAMLETWNKDGDVMSSMFLKLGPDGTVGAMANISSLMGYGGSGDPDAYADLAERLRTGLSTASNDPGFPAEQFGRDLVRYSVAPLLTDEEQRAFAENFPTGMNGANILTFLMQDTNYHDDFLLGAARTLDEFEQMSKDGMLDASGWYNHNGHGPLDTGRDGGWYDDPMAAIMHNFGENPQAGLTFFTEDPDRQKYYFNDRSWEADGYGGISHAVEGIGTDATNLKNHAEDTTGLVSRFLDQVANSPGFNAEDATAASPHIADLLKFYMPAVDSALRNGPAEGDGTSGPFSLDHFGDFDHYPVLFTDDLDSLMSVAMSTQDGTQSIAEGVGGFQKTQLNNIAAELAANPDDPNLRTELRDILQRNASLQGFTEYTVGTVEIEGAADRDAQRQAYIDLVSDAAGMVPLPGADQLGEVGGKLLDYGWSQATELGTNAAGDSWASEEAGATDNAEKRAEAGSNRLKVDTFLSLVESGVIPRDEVPDHWFKNGRLIGVGDIPPEQMGSYTQSAMNGVNDYATNYDLEGAYRESFESFYQPAK
ncbi:DUF6571 family protein [Aeromicrobium duanguangcaii]|uniref:DUF6571 domain-containing protein n=1 Tax=Aeromicrobium duanguangcaii TaxID=2968086 RepID=A0ABY5KCU4_9ACTN|nr:DUF6571 family protein [Aeromicrobium duanguangcaii]MCD9154981.1 hypothetical protein [Aeromicrobium duanguangcaii]UUI67614.1 hypothetical protein NP095_10400 [Aeromicrobium duanguangcaii]